MVASKAATCPQGWSAGYYSTSMCCLYSRQKAFFYLSFVPHAAAGRSVSVSQPPPEVAPPSEETADTCSRVWFCCPPAEIGRAVQQEPYRRVVLLRAEQYANGRILVRLLLVAVVVVDIELKLPKVLMRQLVIFYLLCCVDNYVV